jgi:HlyD family secretion protein
MRKLLVIFLAVALLAGAGWYWRSRSQADSVYQTVEVKRGDVVATITATGTLEPQELVDVGAQVAGLIVSLGRDANGGPIDYRSQVEPNMVLARLDDTVYKADVDTASAVLEQARTAVLKGQAGLAQTKAKLLQAQNNWNRAKAMGPSDALSQNDYDMYQADYETAKANVAAAETDIAQARSGVLLAQASLSKARRNLEFCTIRSPVKGVIIDRRVNIGQTVVASLNAPSLFLIAKDLAKMQIWVAVNEAHIGCIVPGASVTFTCEAFPGREFEGTIGKVRFNATITQNIVMYTVEVNTENPDNILLPYLTANVRFVLSSESGVLTVPNAALRWTPSSLAQIAPDARLNYAANTSPNDPPGSRQASTNEKNALEAARRTLWLKDGEFVRPVEVKLGTSDGVNTAVAAQELREGQVVILSESVAAAQTGTQNPFLPKAIRR